MNRLIRFFLAVSAGIMLSLAWLGMPGWILFGALLPVLLLNDYYTNHRSHYGSFRFWSYTFIAFLVWNGLTTWWIVHATAVGAFLAIVANAFLMSFFVLTGHLIHKHTRKSTGYLAITVLWISFEFFHFHWDIEWPWLMLGNGFANNVRMIQWYAVTGTLGGSVWIWLVNIFLFEFLKKLTAKEKVQGTLSLGIFTGLLVALPVLISLIQYTTYKEDKDPRKVLIIQPNIDPYSETHDEGAMNDKLNKFIRLTESALQPGLDYIVGPETVFEQDWNEDRLPEYPAVLRMRELVKGGQNTALIFGASTFRIYPGPDQATPTARKTRDGLFYDVYNTALCLDTSSKIQTYHKSILVSGVEKMPFRKYLRFMNEWIINLGGTTGTLGIQPEPANFIARDGDQIAPAICYESVFGGYLTKFIRKGAQAIFIITNDGWWKNTPGYRQHFSFARLRAVETRRSIVRAANTGISGLIDQRGNILQSSRWWVDDTLTGTVNFNSKMTFYAKHGDYAGRIAVFISVLLVLKVLTEQIIKSKKKKTASILIV